MLRLLMCARPGEVRLGALIGDAVVDLNRANPALPTTLCGLLGGDNGLLDAARATVEQVAAACAEDRTKLACAGKLYPLADVCILAPFLRLHRNVFCIGRNYLKHAEEGARARGVEFKPPAYPEFFTKPPTAIVGHGAYVPLDEHVTQQLDYEVELAVVIGRRGRNIPREKAYDYVFGYTVANDLSARELQRRHGQWFKGKALDSSCPLGPVVVPHGDLGDPGRLALRLRVNGETRQSANTKDMTWSVPDILFWLSQGTTLEPGDIVLTGTPEGVGIAMSPPSFLKPGDVVEAEVEGIGTLVSYIVPA